MIHLRKHGRISRGLVEHRIKNAGSTRQSQDVTQYQVHNVELAPVIVH
jgi:hypothetical protein